MPPQRRRRIANPGVSSYPVDKLLDYDLLKDKDNLVPISDMKEPRGTYLFLMGYIEKNNERNYLGDMKKKILSLNNCTYHLAHREEIEIEPKVIVNCTRTILSFSVSTRITKHLKELFPNMHFFIIRNIEDTIDFLNKTKKNAKE